MKKNLIVRTITGLLFVLVLVSCIVFDRVSFILLFATITALSVWEFVTIVNKSLNIQVNRLITTVAGVYLFLAVAVFNQGITGSEIFIPYLVSIMYILISGLYVNREKSIYNWAFSMMAQLYVALPFAMLSPLSFFPGYAEGVGNTIIYSPILTLSVFIFLWVSDSGAYLIGSALGKHRLFPSVSPNKSWEGSIGGGVFALVASQIIAMYSKDLCSSNDVINHLEWAGMSIVVVLFGTWGDLVESLLKRRLGIKDSGKILPGHGGMLDRFDSSMMAIPATLVYIYTLQNF